MIGIYREIVQFIGLKNMREILMFSLYGVLFVLMGLLLLSLILLLFKLVNKREMKKLAKEREEKEKDNSTEVEELKHFDEDIVTAIITAIAIEEKLYHEDTLSELTLRYRGETPSGWQLSDLMNNRS